jgi:type II secretory pathway pseudopilin PulG
MYDGEQSNLDAPPPEETSNRTFLIVAGILGGVVLLSLACVAAYVLFVYPNTQKQQQQVIATQNAQNAQVAQALTATAEAASFPTETMTPPPSQTPVIAQATITSTPSTVTPDPATATVGAALTQAAQAQLTIVPTTTALPGTGIADQYGAPGLVLAGMVLVAVIFLARRLRVAPTK